MALCVPNNPAAQPVIGITMGDPAGIGPEVVVKALADPAIRKLARFVVYGLNEQLAYAADLAEIEPYWWRVPHDAARAEHDLVHDVVVLDYDEISMITRDAKPSRLGGQASLTFLDDAIAAALRPPPAPHDPGDGRIDALVTAPVCKASWALAGCRFPGHTELLAHRTKSKRVAMLFDAPPPPEVSPAPPEVTLVPGDDSAAARVEAVPPPRWSRNNALPSGERFRGRGGNFRGGRGGTGGVGDDSCAADGFAESVDDRVGV